MRAEFHHVIRNAMLPSDAVIADQAFDRVHFENCYTEVLRSPSECPVISRVTLRQCKASRCTLGPAVFEYVTIENLETLEPLFVYFPMFNQTTIRGRCGKLSVKPILRSGLPSNPALDAAWRERSRAHYREIEWALDIQQLDAMELELAGVPPHLVRLDHATQGVVIATEIRDDRWKTLDYRKSAFGCAIESMFYFGAEETYLVCCRRNRRFEDDMSALRALRDLGIAI